MARAKLPAHLEYIGVIYSKKNNKRILKNRKTGQRFIGQSEQSLANQRDIADQLALQWHDEPIDEPVKIRVGLWQKDLTRHDLDNQLTSVLDGLVKGEVIIDDNCQRVACVECYFAGVDAKNPGAVIDITPYELPPLPKQPRKPRKPKDTCPF